MQTIPLLSIIVPIYNVEKYLSKCVESILGQTYANFELILVDDGSPGRCGEMIDEYARMDSRIVVVHQENQGLSAARNAGLKIAQGEYVGFVDPDDWIEPDMYEALIRAIEETGCDIAICPWFVNDENGTEKAQEFRMASRVLSEQEYLERLFDMPPTIGGSVCNKLYRAKLIHACFDIESTMYEDGLFNAQYCCSLRGGYMLTVLSIITLTDATA